MPEKSRIPKLLEWLQSSPSDCFLLHALGLEYLKIQDYEQALVYFQKVMETDPGYIGTYYHLAKTLEVLGRYDDARQIYEQGIDRARQAGDKHANNELQMALDELDDA